MVCAGKVRFPGVHQPPAPLEQVGASVSRFDLVADHVGKRHLGDLARVVGPPSRPGAIVRLGSVRCRPARSHVTWGRSPADVSARTSGNTAQFGANWPPVAAMGTRVMLEVSWTLRQKNNSSFHQLPSFKA